jgi:hypothetical protein
MRKTKIKKDLAIQPERSNFLQLLAINPNYFGNIPGSKLKATAS